jgi:hypothetical protein
MATDEATGKVAAAKVTALLNGQYQADREAHLDWWHRIFMFAVIVLGASAVFELLPAWARLTASLATAVTGAADLMFDLSVRARTAAVLRKSYFEIAAALEAGEMNAQQAKTAMLRLSAEEEPPYKAAHAIAENWATRAVFGTGADLPCNVTRWHRITRNLFHHAGHDFGVDA